MSHPRISPPPGFISNKSVKAKYKEMLKSDNKVKEKMEKWREDVVERGRSDLLENQPKKGKK